MSMNRTALAVQALSKYVDDSYPSHLSVESRNWRRIAKVCEEAGETIAAFIGFIGENPRKGFTHSREAVVEELLDTATSALGAVSHIYGNDVDVMILLEAHAVSRAERAGIAA